jgi:hypothetical protein
MKKLSQAILCFDIFQSKFLKSYKYALDFMFLVRYFLLRNTIDSILIIAPSFSNE